MALSREAISTETPENKMINQSVVEKFELINGLKATPFFIRFEDNENIKNAIKEKNWVKKFKGLHIIQSQEEEKELNLLTFQKINVQRNNPDDVLVAIKLSNVFGPELFFPFYIPKNIIDGLFTADNYDSNKLTAVFDCIGKAPVAVRHTLTKVNIPPSIIKTNENDKKVAREDIVPLFKQLFSSLQNASVSIGPCNSSKKMEIKLDNENKRNKVAELLASAVLTPGAKTNIVVGKGPRLFDADKSSSQDATSTLEQKSVLAEKKI